MRDDLDCQFPRYALQLYILMISQGLSLLTSFLHVDFQVPDYVPDPSVLALRSIRHTPTPGSFKSSSFVRSTLREVLSQDVRASVLEEAFDDNIDIQINDVL
jgi:hypothetical protein